VAAFIAAQRAQHGIAYSVACRALGVSQSWFYKWRHGDTSVRRARRQGLTALVVALFGRHRGSYGSPRITDDLRAMGWRVSVNTIAAIMAERHLVARAKRRRRGLTRPDKSARKAPDLLRRKFTAPAAPNLAWVGDLTEIPNDEGPLHLAAILDLHSRRAVGFALDAHHDAQLAAACVAGRHRGTRRRRGWGDLPLRPGRRVHRGGVHPGVPAGRGSPVDGPHRVGPR